jgi:D-sedoheptulose 7-phosphate isomerase
MNVINRYPVLKQCEESIQDSIKIISDCFKSKGKLLLVGNGGSACDCDHISGELLKGFKSSREIKNKKDLDLLGGELACKLQGSLPAIPLTNFQGLGTAYNNDCDPEYTYAQLVWGIGVEKDVLLAISTSGNSKNIINSVMVGI